MLDAKLFGIREICDVVLRAKAPQKIGNRIFYTNEPVLYFDTLKTSTFEGAATTVYAQGGRGNARLVAWDGERTVTFTMEDALISPAGLSILTGAGLIEATNDKPIYVHTTDQLQLHDVGTGTLTDPGDCKFTYEGEGTSRVVTGVEIKLKEEPAAYNVNEDYAYVMVLDSRGVVDSEPYIGQVTTGSETIKIKSQAKSTVTPATWRTENYTPTNIDDIVNGGVILVDYYVAKKTKALQMNITPDKFGGTFYLEASTLWRDEATGLDLPAEFIIPKCKIQSNFTFNLSSSGDPSTFTFTMDALPDYTRFDKSEKVLASIQVVGADDDKSEYRRIDTKSSDDVDGEGIITRAGTNFTLSGVNEGEIIEISHETEDTTTTWDTKDITIIPVGKNDLTYTVASNNADKITVTQPVNNKFTITGSGTSTNVGATAIITVTGTAEDETNKVIKLVAVLT